MKYRLKFCKWGHSENKLTSTNTYWEQAGISIQGSFNSHICRTVVALWVKASSMLHDRYVQSYRGNDCPTVSILAIRACLQSFIAFSPCFIHTPFDAIGFSQNFFRILWNLADQDLRSKSTQWGNHPLYNSGHVLVGFVISLGGETSHLWGTCFASRTISKLTK